MELVKSSSKQFTSQTALLGTGTQAEKAASCSTALHWTWLTPAFMFITSYRNDEDKPNHNVVTLALVR